METNPGNNHSRKPHIQIDDLSICYHCESKDLPDDIVYCPHCGFPQRASQEDMRTYLWELAKKKHSIMKAE